MNVVEQMKSQLRSTTMEDSVGGNELEELYESISILTDGSQSLNEDMGRLNSELVDHEARLQSVVENVEQVKGAVEEDNNLLEGITRNVELLQQDLMALQEKIDDMENISYDGTYTWKISKVQEKMSKYMIFFLAMLIRVLNETNHTYMVLST